MKKCFFCDKKNGNVLDFTDETFKKCSLMLEFRRLKGFKHGYIQLPKRSSCIGYHSLCISKIWVLKNKYKNEYDLFCNLQKVSENKKGLIAILPRIHNF